MTNDVVRDLCVTAIGLSYAGNDMLCLDPCDFRNESKVLAMLRQSHAIKKKHYEGVKKKITIDDFINDSIKAIEFIDKLTSKRTPCKTVHTEAKRLLVSAIAKERAKYEQ